MGVPHKKHTNSPKASSHGHKADISVFELGAGRRGGTEEVDMNAVSLEADSSNRAGNSESLALDMGEGEAENKDIALSGFGGEACNHVGSGVASQITVPREKWTKVGVVSYSPNASSQKRTLTLFIYVTKGDQIWGAIHKYREKSGKIPCDTTRKVCSTDADCQTPVLKGLCNLSDGACHTCTPVCDRKTQGSTNGNPFWHSCEKGKPEKVKGLVAGSRAFQIGTMLYSTAVPPKSGKRSCFSKCSIPEVMFEKNGKTCNANDKSCIAIKCAFNCLNKADHQKLCT